MIYTDKIHLIADSLQELHTFAEEQGIKRCWFEGVKKGHPHYDIPKKKLDQILKIPKIQIVRPREILSRSKILAEVCKEYVRVNKMKIKI